MYRLSVVLDGIGANYVVWLGYITRTTDIWTEMDHYICINALNCCPIEGFNNNSGFVPSRAHQPDFASYVSRHGTGGIAEGGGIMGDFIGASFFVLKIIHKVRFYLDRTYGQYGGGDNCISDIIFSINGQKRAFHITVFRILCPCRGRGGGAIYWILLHLEFTF